MKPITLTPNMLVGWSAGVSSVSVSLEQGLSAEIRVTIGAQPPETISVLPDTTLTFNTLSGNVVKVENLSQEALTVSWTSP